jgi:hypothetical protein
MNQDTEDTLWWFMFLLIPLAGAATFFPLTFHQSLEIIFKVFHI